MELYGTGHHRCHTNVLLAEDLIREAETLRIDLSKAAEAGVARAVQDRRAQIWLDENRAALVSSNAYVETHGLPLDSIRLF